MNLGKLTKHLITLAITILIVGSIVALFYYVSILSKIVVSIYYAFAFLFFVLEGILGFFTKSDWSGFFNGVVVIFTVLFIIVSVLFVYSIVWTLISGEGSKNTSVAGRKLSIHKNVYGNREWLRSVKQSSDYTIPLDTLYSANFEVNAENVRRPVGALVTLSHSVLQKHRQQILDGTAARSQDALRANPPTFWDLVENKNTDEFDFYHRTHTIAHIFSLDEGETKGLTFTGTGYLDSGNDYQNGFVFQSQEASENGKADPRHGILVETLFDYYLDKKGSANYDGDNIVCEFIYPTYNFHKLGKEDFDITSIHSTANRGDISQISMLHFERLANRIINYFKNDEFIYSCELLYQNPEDKLVFDVEIILYNRSQNRTEFIVYLGNIEK